jgi:hypothetical protein
MPLRLIYNLGSGRLQGLASFGLTPQILMDQTTTFVGTTQDGEVVTEEFPNGEDAAGFNLSPMVGLGVHYALSEHFIFRAEGIARFGVVNINEDSPINSYIYSSELGLSISYIIK